MRRQSLRLFRILGRYCAAALLLAHWSLGAADAAPNILKGTQPMAILGGTEVSFTSGRRHRIPAYCTNENLSTPDYGGSFDNYHGRVRVTFRGGRTESLELKEAGRYVRIEGAGDYYSVIVSAKDPNVTKISFDGAGLAHQGPPAEFERAKNYLPTFERLTAGEVPAKVGAAPGGNDGEAFGRAAMVVESVIWENPFSIIQTAVQTGKTTTYEHINSDPTSTLSQTVLNLDSQGDAILLKTPGGKNLLIDTGLTQGAFRRILSKLPPNVDLNIILTHPDKDHINNAILFLQQSGIAVENVLMSSYDNQTKTLARLKEFLAQPQYSVTNLANSPIALYSKPSPGHASTIKAQAAKYTAPEAGIKLDSEIRSLFSAEDLRRVESIPGTAPFARYEFGIERGVRVEVYQKKNPGSPNESSLITRITHKGVSTLYTGDINDKVMRDFVEYRDMIRNDLARTGTSQDAKFIELFASQFPEAYATLKAKHLADIKPGITEGTRAQMRQAFLQDLGRHLSSAGEKVEDELLGHLAEYMRGPDSVRHLNLSSKFLKWPHHGWLAKYQNGREVLKRFIELVNPDTILFSVSPQGIKGQDLGEVRQFLSDNFPGRRFDIRTTPEDGNVEWRTQYDRGRKSSHGAPVVGGQ